MYNINEYIRYVRQRVYYAELNLISINDDEYLFYKNISDNIVPWIRQHCIYPDYWLKGCSVKYYVRSTHINRKTVYRHLYREYNMLIHIILKLENEGDKKWKR